MTQFNSKFSLGEKVQDKVTGFIGRIVGISFWLNGCVQCGVKATVDKDGKIREAEWFDDQQLALVSSNERQGAQKKTGGPQSDAPRC